MDRLCGALCVCPSKKIEKSVEDWKLPPSSASDVIKRSSIFKFSGDPTVKTVEKEIPLSEGYSSFPICTDNLRGVYKGEALDLYIGIIEVGLKPTKLGSNASAIICLRDKRRLTFHNSVFGMVESSLSDGPIYFSFIPTHRLNLSDPCLSSCLTLDVKIQGSNSNSTVVPGDGNIILMYRFHYKLMTRYSEEDQKKLSRRPVDGKGETTLFLTNAGRRNGVVSKKMYWDQLSVPEPWMDENNPYTYSSSSAAAAEDGGNWIETAEAYAMQMDIIGFEKGEVQVVTQADRNILIRGERLKAKEKKKNDRWLYSVARSSGKFLRRFEVPENANMGEAEAAVENEVLTITLPKGEETSSWSTSQVLQVEGSTLRSCAKKRPNSVYVRW